MTGHADARPDPGKKRLRVLVVDDSITVREVQRQILRQHGYDVEVAVDGQDGWNQVRAGAFDLVISDIDMPRLSGLEFVRRIREDYALRDLPVIVVSYKDRDEDRGRISDRDIERAREACRQIAENRDWRNVRTEVRDRDRNGRVVLEVSGRRRGEDRDRECRYDVRRGDAEFDDQG